MIKKIFNSIFFASITVFSVSLVLICSVLFGYFGNLQKDSLAEQTSIAVHEYNKNEMKYLSAFDSDTYRITLIAHDGTVLYDSVKNPSEMENHSEREEIKSALKSGVGTSERYSQTILEKTYNNARILDDGNIIRLSVTKNSVWTLFLGLLQPVAAILIIAFILSVVLSSRLSGRIVKPLEKLDLDNPLENDTYDELSGVLSKIDRQHKELAKKAELLARKKDEFLSVTESMNEGLILIGTGNEILSMNSAAAKIFSVSGETDGKNIVTAVRNPEVQSAAEKAANGKASEFLLEISGREYQINANPVMTGDKTGGVCLLIFDVTEKNNNERIRREFTANVSHELKTPLHSIMGASELLKNGLVKPEDTCSFATRIHSEASRLVTLVDDIIRLSQLDEGVAPAAESLDLAEIAGEAAEALSGEAEKRNITVNVLGESTVMNGVPRLIYEIIYNLCDNAIRYNVENGSVKISVYKDKDYAVLNVSDTGIGIPAESKSRIFERFYRVDKSHSRQTGGTGLGLSIVRHAAIYHGAEISVDSTLGKGTSITVSFPLSTI